VLELDAVAKHFPGSPPVRALDTVSLTITAGELTALIGPSGSGKSTLMNVIGTLDRPTAGEVRIDGIATTSLSDAALAGLRAARVGFVFQQFHLLEGADIVDNVAAGLLYRGIRRGERRRRASIALERVGLGHRLKHRPPQLSGGERQRVAIARAIVGEPAIVLADEPTGNLDSTTSASIIDLMRGLNDDGATIIVITHDTELANTFRRQVAMRDGHIVGDSQQAMPASERLAPEPLESEPLEPEPLEPVT
jgi:putative ABC transport system ATP-binding protein